MKAELGQINMKAELGQINMKAELGQIFVTIVTCFIEPSTFLWQLSCFKLEQVWCVSVLKLIFPAVYNLGIVMIQTCAGLKSEEKLMNLLFAALV